ncbi:hypothetical protein C8R43DRAFT_944078 [Mycena crocata]|nr:hypothetical protein C8R43DRAFT_944078 [Mycena crocata]
MSQSETFTVIKHRPSDVHDGYVCCPIAIYAKEGTILKEESQLCFVWTVHETNAGIDGIYVQRAGAETAVVVSQCPNTVLKQHNSIAKAAKFLNYVCRTSDTCRARFERELKAKADAEFEKQLDAAEEFYGAGKHCSTIHTSDEASRVESQPAEGENMNIYAAAEGEIGSNGADGGTQLQFYDMNMYAADLGMYAADLGMYADDELGYPDDEDNDMSGQSSPACSICHDAGCDTFTCPGA